MVKISEIFMHGVTSDPQKPEHRCVWHVPQEPGVIRRLSFSLDDPHEAYTNAGVYNKVPAYAQAARQVHGPDYDPSTDDIDGDLVMRIGGGKKHGRYWIGNNVIDRSTTTTLYQIRASTTSVSNRPPIRPRPEPAQHRVDAIQVVHYFSIVLLHIAFVTFALL